jgi:serine/threonine-protein kinase
MVGRVTPTRIGRYKIHDPVASGGMASVHLGKLSGPGGFARTVAIKRMHPHLVKDAEFARMFVDEARVAARVHHPNVVSTLDVLTVDDELLIVMEYVHGESLSELLRVAAGRKQRVPAGVACAIVADLLSGLQAAHEATDDRGVLLGIVHRDVSPHNVLVGADGVARVLDFGVAKAIGRLSVTREGQVKGKIAYMAPEQVRGLSIGPSVDVYAAGVVLWEALTGQRLFEGKREADVVEKILFGTIEAPAAVEPRVPEELNDIALRALSRDPAYRFASAREMARALVRAARRASASEVGDWVEELAGPTLQERARLMATIDRSEATDRPGAPPAGGSAMATKPHLPAAPARVRLVRRAAVAAAAVGLLVGGAVALGRGPAALTASRGPPPPVLSKTQTMEASSLATQASAPAAEPAESSPTVAASLPAVAVPSQPRRPILQPAPVKRPAPHSAAGACDPPYTTDADGTRHYKLQCL